jgi:hypothetical protein
MNSCKKTINGFALALITSSALSASDFDNDWSFMYPGEQDEYVLGFLNGQENNPDNGQTKEFDGDRLYDLLAKYFDPNKDVTGVMLGKRKSEHGPNSAQDTKRKKVWSEEDYSEVLESWPEDQHQLCITMIQMIKDTHKKTAGILIDMMKHHDQIGFMRDGRCTKAWYDKLGFTAKYPKINHWKNQTYDLRKIASAARSALGLTEEISIAEQAVIEAEVLANWREDQRQLCRMMMQMIKKNHDQISGVLIDIMKYNNYIDFMKKDPCPQKWYEKLGFTGRYPGKTADHWSQYIHKIRSVAVDARIALERITQQTSNKI